MADERLDRFLRRDHGNVFAHRQPVSQLTDKVLVDDARSLVMQGLPWSDLQTGATFDRD